MRASLFSRSGTFKGHSFEIADEATIGRGEDNTIVLKSRTVSGRHARIFVEEGGSDFMVEDLGSLNGTRVDGILTVGQERLGRLHVITFADDVEFIFRLRDEKEMVRRETLPEADAPEWPAQKGDERTTLAEGDSPQVPGGLLEKGPPLILTLGDERHVIAPGEHSIGRGDESEITLADESVSRRHALLVWREGRATLEDLESSNGTFAGDREIFGKVFLQLPTSVRFGAAEAWVEKGRGSDA